MENRDDIIRKLNALRDKANGTSNPHEAIIFMQKFNELMQKYKLTETDLEIKRAGIHTMHKGEGTNRHASKANAHPMHKIVCQIADVTGTDVRTITYNDWGFIGTPADLQYADWLYGLIRGTMDRGWIAFKMSPDYHALVNKGQKSKVIQDAWHKGYVHAINAALIAMANEHKTTGTDLVVLKNALIEAFKHQHGINSGKRQGNNLTVADGLNRVKKSGYDEGKKVTLRKSAESAVKGYLQ